MVPRLALRQSRWMLQRRAASTTTEAVSSGAAKAKDSASEVAGKAQQGLSRVSSSAGSTVNKLVSSATSTVTSIGGRTGQVITFAQSKFPLNKILAGKPLISIAGLVPPTIYYARVGGELMKLVFKGRNMNPP